MILQHAPVEELTPHETGRRLLEQMYCQQFGTPMPPVKKGSRGKPFFEGNPVYFSITHTRSHVFCALAPHPIGIDAEEEHRQIRPELAQKILSAGEFARYEASADRNQTLLRLWVLKEAQGKCTGQGINGWPVHTDFSPDDPRITITHGCVLAVVQEEPQCYLTPTPI